MLKNENKNVIQYLVAFVATLNMFSVAIGIGWTSPTLPILLGDDSPIATTRDQASWIVAISVIGLFISPIPAAYIMDKYGRKTALLISAIPSIIAWILVALADSIMMLLLSRIFIGITNGIIYTVMPMYLAEIASNQIRGSIGVITIIALKGGILFAYIVGQCVSINALGWISIIFPILFICIFPWCPETPYHLMNKNKMDKSLKSLMHLRGHANVHAEYEQMACTVKSKQEKQRPTFREIITPQNRQSLLIIIALGTISQLNGCHTIMAYAEMIFEQIGSRFSAGNVTIILGAIQLLASICGSIFIDKFGRRYILLISIIASIICNAILAIYFYLQKLYDLSQWAWFPIVIIWIFSAFAIFGIGTLPMVILGEIFPSHLKGIAAIVLVITGGLCTFIMAKAFQIIIDSLGYDVMFGIFSIINLVYTPYFWYKLPETKGKSFHVILEELHAKSIK